MCVFFLEVETRYTMSMICMYDYIERHYLFLSSLLYEIIHPTDDEIRVENIESQLN